MAICELIFSLVIFTIFLPQDVVSEFRLASYYSDHMVLQMQPSSAVVWGYGTAGATVHISFANLVYKTVVGEKESAGEGIWMRTLDPQPAGGPHTITIEQDSSSIQLQDVYFGDVWFCSGQSNMRFHMNQVFDAEDELAKAQNYTELRFLKTPATHDTVPHEDVNPPPGPWSGPNQSSLSKFSALCWMYGEQLYDRLKVPVGLIQSTWGGTYVETWSSPDVLSKCRIQKKNLKLSVNPTTNLPAPGRNNHASTLWNAMVYPYLKMVIRGVIWYQGEANTEYNLHLYKCTFPNLITDWRVKWYEQSQGHTNKTFPFGFMQLASNNDSASMMWPWLRWHQTLDKGFVPNPSMPNTFMAVAMDLADDHSPYKPLHPRDKKTMATRLGYAGLNVAYGQSDLPFVGPQLVNIIVDENSAKMVYNQQVKLIGQTGFKYCCLNPDSACDDDTSTTDWLEPTLYQYNSTTIKLETTCAPSTIAYAWQQRPCNYKDCPVYADDEYSLPAAPWKWQIIAQHQRIN